jgi:2-C-methyl-D-erythritol 4-phosphate cytidylyltransferase
LFRIIEFRPFLTEAMALTDPARFYALVPCAGTGERAAAQGPKQYALVGGKSVVAHTLSALAGVARLHAVLVVLSPTDAGPNGFSNAAPGFDGWTAAVGGSTRAATVANGLRVRAERGARPDDWVLVHDAARCLIRPEWIDALIDACADDAVGGLLALPLADTLKAEQGGRVAATLDRSGKWAAQTPQMFRLGLLADALAHAGASVTDEASALEARGHAPKLVVGSFENFKITWPADFALAERLLRTR